MCGCDVGLVKVYEGGGEREEAWKKKGKREIIKCLEVHQAKNDMP